jgi:hypothetical protein
MASSIVAAATYDAAIRPMETGYLIVSSTVPRTIAQKAPLPNGDV